MKGRFRVSIVWMLAATFVTVSTSADPVGPPPAEEAEVADVSGRGLWKNAGSVTPLAAEPEVCDVAAGGSWEDQGSYGRCRIVVRLLGWETAGTFVYAQWLRSDEKTQQDVLLRSLPVAELNRRLDLFVDDVSYEYGNGTDEHTTFLLKASSRETNRPRTVRIVLGKPGEILSVKVEGVPDHPQSE